MSRIHQPSCRRVDHDGHHAPRPPDPVPPKATFTVTVENFKAFSTTGDTGFSYTTSERNGSERGYNPPELFGETIRGLLNAKFEITPDLNESWTFNQVGESRRFL